MAARPKNTLILRARRAQVILQNVARKYSFTLEAMRSDDRDKRLVAARREYCRQAKAEGIGSTTIGKILCRHQDTIRYHFNPKKALVRQERYLRSKLVAQQLGEHR